jgi:hypothetical protein
MVAWLGSSLEPEKISVEMTGLLLSHPHVSGIWKLAAGLGGGFARLW